MLFGIRAFINPFMSTIKVEGTGYIKVSPDIAIVNFGVITENEHLTIAQDENAESINRVIESLIDLGIESKNIKTYSYIIDPQYDYIDGKKILRGYIVIHNLTVFINEINSVGNIIDVSVENGINQVNDIEFSVSDIRIPYQKALEAAVDDALIKSKTLGKKLNITVSSIPVHIVESNYYMDNTRLLAETKSATKIHPGELTISARIEAVFIYRPMF